MVRIFKDGRGAFAVQTTCLEMESFMSDLAEALSTVAKENDDGGITLSGVLECAMPIAFKLSGYKADTVQEQRTLLCGALLPHESSLVVSAGR